MAKSPFKPGQKVTFSKTKRNQESALFEGEEDRKIIAPPNHAYDSRVVESGDNQTTVRFYHGGEATYPHDDLEEVKHLKSLQKLCSLQQKQIKQLIGLSNILFKMARRNPYTEQHETADERKQVMTENGFNPKQQVEWDDEEAYMEERRISPYLTHEEDE